MEGFTRISATCRQSGDSVLEAACVRYSVSDGPGATRHRSEAARRSADTTIDHNKALVRRLVEAVHERNLDALNDVSGGAFARLARRWISPFRQSFPDFRMEIVDLIAEGDTVVAYFRCSGTHEGAWLDYPATGKRFEGVDEIYIFRVEEGRLVSATAVEDNLARLRQLGLFGTPVPASVE